MFYYSQLELGRYPKMFVRRHPFSGIVFVALFCSLGLLVTQAKADPLLLLLQSIFPLRF
jgi:hypothetical protein